MNICENNFNGNGFAPVCQCCPCLKTISAKTTFCFDANPIRYQGKIKRKPKFNLFFKSGIPCLECKRIDCPGSFLHSKPCTQRSDCNIACNCKDWWVKFLRRGHKNVWTRIIKRPQSGREITLINSCVQHRNLFWRNT